MKAGFKTILGVIPYVLLSCIASGQNIWVENNTVQFGCSVRDSIRIQIFDIDSVIDIDTVRFDLGDGTDFLLQGPNSIDTSVAHEYPGCGSFIRSFFIPDIVVAGENVISTHQPYYYYYELINFDLIRGYRKAPTFNLQYQISKCQTIDWFMNPLQSELDGDSLVFFLDTLDTNIITPSGVFVNEKTGELSWMDMPTLGDYQFILHVHEYDASLIDYRLARHLIRFTIRVTDNCKTLIAHDHLDQINLFEQPGRNFKVDEGSTWNYSYRVAKGDWDSINISPASEIFQPQFASNYTISDLGDSLELILSWQTANGHKRPHPYLLTHHITAWKNGKDHHRVLTNAIYVDWPTGTGKDPESEVSFSIYPNPATDRLMIDGFQGQPITVSIFDLVGRPLINKAPYEGAIDIHQLQAGSYIVQIETPSGTHTSVIQKL